MKGAWEEKWRQIRESLARASQKASEQVDRAVRMADLRFRMHTKESQLRENFRQIGEQVFRHWRAGREWQELEPTLKTLLEEALKSYEELAALRETLQELQNKEEPAEH